MDGIRPSGHVDSVPTSSSVDNLIPQCHGGNSNHQSGPSQSTTATASNMDTKSRMSADTKSHVADVTMAEAVDQEHALGFREAIRLYPTAVGWSLFVSLGVIMLAFDPQIVGSMYAMPQFQKDFGHESRDGEV